MASADAPETTGEQATGPSDQGPAAAAPPTLSRKAQKRQRRQAEFDAHREEFKKARKEKRVQLKQRRREEREKQIEEGTYVPPERKKGPPVGQAGSGVRVVLDMDFDDKMSEKDMESAAAQVARCYSVNRAAKKTVDLVAAACGPKMTAALSKRVPDWTKWKNFISFDERQYHQMNEKDDIIYLSADSPDVLERLEPGKSYIIGGLVDHNKHKGLCQDRAMKLGIKTARLPISEFIVLASRKVLTINQVLEIMLKYLDMESWRGAFMETIPQRKLQPKVVKPAGKDPEGGAAEDEEDADADVDADGEHASEDEENNDEFFQEANETLAEHAAGDEADQAGSATKADSAEAGEPHGGATSVAVVQPAAGDRRAAAPSSDDDEPLFVPARVQQGSDRRDRGRGGYRDHGDRDRGSNGAGHGGANGCPEGPMGPPAIMQPRSIKRKIMSMED
ncbi:tRNA methyltransferase 10 [Irineochytrium annulatum]|nr:tRNA methyltransferase 10 [Irineochytrium annulatum]